MVPKIVTSLTAAPDSTSAGLVYLTSALVKHGINYLMVDLSGKIDYHAPPAQLLQSCRHPGWMNPRNITDASWMDAYLPELPESGPLLFSAQFSPDILFHARQSFRCKAKNRHMKAAIGGCALSGLSLEQLNFISKFFDFVFVGYPVGQVVRMLEEEWKHSGGRQAVTMLDGPPDIEPEYALVEMRRKVTVYSGHGCYYAKCRFCDYPSRSRSRPFRRSPERVAADLRQVMDLNPASDIMLTQDAYSEKQLRETATAVLGKGPGIRYNLMFRAESWVNRDLAQTLAESGCTEVFIGGEALDDRILAMLCKGVSTDRIVHALRALSGSVHLTLGLILFVPGIEESWLDAQEERLASVLDCVDEIEPEILTIVNGSEFARSPQNYGIQLYPAERWINDSWCFGLSQDIPWTFENPLLISSWLRHCERLKQLCAGRVRSEYWARVDRLRDRLSGV